MTFASTANTVIHAGATPVLADVHRQTMCLDAGDIEHRITDRTRAIVPVHFAGRPCDMDAITAIAARHDLAVIEDAGHASETLYHGHHGGTFGHFGTIGFDVS